MFGIGFSELLIIFGLALIIFGPDKLPEMARSLGKVLGDLRRHSDEVKREIYDGLYSVPPQRKLDAPPPAQPDAAASAEQNAKDNGADAGR